MGAVSRRLDGPQAWLVLCRTGVVAKASLSPHAISAANDPDDAPPITPDCSWNRSTSVAQYRGFGNTLRRVLNGRSSMIRFVFG